MAHPPSCPSPPFLASLGQVVSLLLLSPSAKGLFSPFPVTVPPPVSRGGILGRSAARVWVGHIHTVVSQDRAQNWLSQPPTCLGATQQPLAHPCLGTWGIPAQSSSVLGLAVGCDCGLRGRGGAWLEFQGCWPLVGRRPVGVRMPTLESGTSSRK